jgi:uncharacterized protein YraI
MRPLLTALLLAATLLPASAAEPTARVSGDISVRQGPGTNYQVIGKLPDGARVELDYCTRNKRWCLVSDIGWVNASYLVGSGAKLRVTPFSFIGGAFADDDDRTPGSDW